MAIAFDASSTGEQVPGTSPITFSHTCTGSNLVLLVGVETITTCSGVTYNGVAMTQLVTTNVGGVVNYLFGLVAPATGANNVVVSFTGGSTYCRAVAASYTGVSQTGLPDATGSNTIAGSSTTMTTTLTTVANNCWTALFTFTTVPGATAGTGTTLRKADAQSYAILFDSNGAVVAGSNSLIINYTSGTGTVGVMVSIAPVSTTSTQGLMAFFM